MTNLSITEADLKELEELCGKAIRGPWEPSDIADQPFKCRIGGFDYNCPPGSAQVRAPLSLIPTRCLIPYGIISHDDAKFIAASRTAIPKLIAEIRNQRAALIGWENDS